ncbi:C4-dicarboxylate transporter DcuC [Acetonema longum]|uniref:C4-dicarboxylate anaerobic carrier n=1 Tax=Acetonema longum DSM 6540 TaxID=1009370 RepID=F7NDI5_9FIRM|nr:C4-dicarboxylate transporter DcuC [Acetonema longum]EGO65847.1 C4-dicarboxylate anaerobic carrier [Acetonema longum DSM 6540]
MIWLGGIIVVLTFYAIIKRWETRMVLFASGLVMAAIAGKVPDVIDAFAKAMINGGLVPVICTVMGFAFVMKYTGCDKHMVQFLTGGITRMQAILIPASVMITFAINIALPSAAGCSAAVGAILIPTLIKAGVHPAIAGSAILAGTYGGTLSPGSAHPPFIAKLAGTDVMSVIAGHTVAAILCGLIGAIVLLVVAIVRKENKGCNIGESEAAADTSEKLQVNYIKAIVPIVPLALLVLGSKQINVLPAVSVPEAMIFGTILGLIVCRCNPQTISKEFFNGMGEAYGSVIGIIIAAAVFTKGMELIGLTGSLIEVMKHSEQIARFAAAFGPMIVAILSGSGDAATLAFNGAITPHAQDFGFGISQMGSAAFLSGSFGRSMSPVAGAAIVCAQLAGVDPIELAKRNAPGMILAAIAGMLLLL